VTPQEKQNHHLLTLIVRDCLGTGRGPNLRVPETAAQLVELVRHSAVGPADYNFDPKLYDQSAEAAICFAARLRDIGSFAQLIRQIQRCDGLELVDLAVALTDECWNAVRPTT
jgi:hypothetical protein